MMSSFQVALLLLCERGMKEDIFFNGTQVCNFGKLHQLFKLMHPTIYF